jgi:serine/threonine protein kinase
VTSNRPVAIKVILKSSIDSPVAKTRLQRELALLKQMKHPFIAELFFSGEDANNYYLVMEFVENCNLLEYVNDHGRLSEDQARRYFAELISVLDYLHNEKHVAHRDLKCENILLDHHNNVRIIDFGLSNVFNEASPTLQTACGSPAYVAPEMIQGQPYTQAADIWSSGIVLFSICAGWLPFDDDNVQRLLQKVVYTEVNYPPFLSPQLIDLLDKMICKEPENRITIDGVKNHPWFSQTEYMALLQEAGHGIWDQDEGEPAIDPEIIGAMTALGLDCRRLHESLLTEDLPDMTALYRILRREKLVESNKDLLTKVPTVAMTLKPVRALPGVFRPSGQAQSNSTTPRGLLGGRVPIAVPSIAASPLTAGKGPQRLSAPAGPGVNSGRRMSRPMAIRRPVAAGGAGPGAHETP